uniref:band 7 protein AGAP004871-like isoform X2 n=1 Tax=Myxine glutinosa TaxID=7769 RepID=UPI00358EC71F
MSRSSRNSREERRRRGNWKHDAGPWADVDTCGGVGRTTVVDVDGAAPAGLIGQDATEFEHLDIGHSSRHVPPCELLLTFLSSLLILLTFPFSLVFCIKIVHENQRAVIFRFGRLRSLRACRPGLFLVQPCLDTYKRVDVRTRTIEIPYHEVVTADMITVGVDAVCYCRVENATRWLTCVRNPELAVQLMAQTHLKALLARSTFSRLLAERQAISQQLQLELNAITGSWGAAVERADIKDVRVPKELQLSMAVEAEATRQARAKVIAAESERTTAIELRQAADLLADSPAALHLRSLMALGAFAAGGNSTLLMPLPCGLPRQASGLHALLGPPDPANTTDSPML